MRFEGGARQQLRAQLDQLAGEIDRIRAELAAEALTGAERQVTLRQVAAYIDARTSRRNIFGDDLFFDPAWDIMLRLTYAWLQEMPMPMGKLVELTDIPQTTVLRWVSLLQDAGLVCSAAGDEDKRRKFVALTPDGFAAMTQWFCELADRNEETFVGN